MTAFCKTDNAAFARLHQKGDPLILFNIWDAGSAVAVADAGAKAIATGSLSLAASQGFADGEGIPFDDLLNTVRQIRAVVDLPLTVDFETGFAISAQGVRTNAEALDGAGAVGCNIEDRLLGDDGLRIVEEQADRISAAVAGGLFVNARTDIFLSELMQGKDPNRSELVDEAIVRGNAYADAGAGCFFVPGLSDPDMIATICSALSVPVNVMRLPDMVPNTELRKLGVARISYGPAPWREAMEAVTQSARSAFA
ncbi:MAG: isocitrate lyase/phosphoenolpyruvate mutase family protein [Pseudomonadota bacterium]|nr:isocitrate lyase/phosphoenolpyruvate mutase family protein [Pseudomonadota bacterium]